MKERILYLNVILWFTLFIDQVTKRIAEHCLLEGELHSYLWDTLRIQYIKNTGAFLSFGSDFPEIIKLFLFILFPLIALIIGIFYIIYSKSVNNFIVGMLSLIIGGGFGNLVDRILEGKVTDLPMLALVLYAQGYGIWLISLL